MGLSGPEAVRTESSTEERIAATREARTQLELQFQRDRESLERHDGHGWDPERAETPETTETPESAAPTPTAASLAGAPLDADEGFERD